MHTLHEPLLVSDPFDSDSEPETSDGGDSDRLTENTLQPSTTDLSLDESIQSETNIEISVNGPEDDTEDDTVVGVEEEEL